MAVFKLRVLHLCRLFRAGRDDTNPTTPLQYRDVFALYDARYVASPSSGFVRGLRAEGMLVCVLEGIDRVGGRVGLMRRGLELMRRVMRQIDDLTVDGAGWESPVADVAVSRMNQVTVAGWRCVQGLERRVVVWLSDRRGFRSAADHYHGLVGLSRCTTQLVTVSPPR